MAGLRDAWQAFDSNVMTTDPEHFLTVLEHRPEAVRPHVVHLTRDGRSSALLVGRIEDIELPARIGYRKVLAPRLRALTVVPGGYLGDTDDSTAARCLSELQGALDRGEADVLRLRLLEVGTPLHRLARTVPSALSRERHARASVHWQATIPDSYDEWLRSLSKSTRTNVRYYGNKIRNEFGERARLETFHDGSDLERLYRDSTAVAAKTYQHALGASIRDDELRRALTDLEVRRGWFRAYVLYLDDEPAAFWYATVFNGVVYTGYTGYDPKYGDFRVGTFVLARLLEDACADPEVSLLDFGYGDADYKRRFGSDSWLEEDVLVFASSWKGIRSNLGRTAVLGASRLSRWVLQRSDGVARAKRWWRDRLRSEKKT